MTCNKVILTQLVFWCGFLTEREKKWSDSWCWEYIKPSVCLWDLPRVQPAFVVVRWQRKLFTLLVLMVFGPLAKPDLISPTTEWSEQELLHPTCSHSAELDIQM